MTTSQPFFVELGLLLQGEGDSQSRCVDRVVGLEGARADIAMMFHSPSIQGDNRHAPANTPGIRQVAFAVEDIDAVIARLQARGAELVGERERCENSYRLCYARSPLGNYHRTSGADRLIADKNVSSLRRIEANRRWF